MTAIGNDYRPRFTSYLSGRSISNPSPANCLQGITVCTEFINALKAVGLEMKGPNLYAAGDLSSSPFAIYTRVHELALRDAQAWKQVSMGLRAVGGVQYGDLSAAVKEKIAEVVAELQVEEEGQYEHAKTVKFEQQDGDGEGVLAMKNWEDEVE
ncbi:hypothetical protein Slin15195_G006940 [Septoria linicola]|uniref:Uncharacterized protein n=1 Tax=Septoria linicola TaxID=215465 RepID=A0A9Q9AE00_9PEZI|nr:hypothetical protein Slin14017_G006950 [Septoria linicola]USW47375.1 hypothetical protein Slin15195_G006940 [Septoria linicola]